MKWQDFNFIKTKKKTQPIDQVNDHQLVARRLNAAR